MEPSRKIQRTFPPADIRDEALSVPSMERIQSTSQKESTIQTNSSITIEPNKPTNDIKKPKVNNKGKYLHNYIIYSGTW